MERQAEDLSRRVRVAQLERNRAVFVWLHNRQTDRLVHVNRDHCDLDVPRHGGESQSRRRSGFRSRADFSRVACRVDTPLGFLEIRPT